MMKIILEQAIATLRLKEPLNWAESLRKEASNSNKFPFNIVATTSAAVLLKKFMVGMFPDSLLTDMLSDAVSLTAKVKSGCSVPLNRL